MSELERLVHVALESLQNDPAHDLRLDLRRMIWCALGDGNTGHSRRVQLQLLAVQHVLSRWDEAFPCENIPRAAIAIAEAYRDGKLDEATAVANAGRFWTQCDNLAYKFNDRQAAIMVGCASVRLIYAALSDSDFECGSSEIPGTDFDVDPYLHDASFFAAAAWSNGPAWERASNSQMRLEFWRWWLTEAVDSAATYSRGEHD